MENGNKLGKLTAIFGALFVSLLLLTGCGGGTAAADEPSNRLQELLDRDAEEFVLLSEALSVVEFIDSVTIEAGEGYELVITLTYADGVEVDAEAIEAMGGVLVMQLGALGEELQAELESDYFVVTAIYQTIDGEVLFETSVNTEE